MALVLDRVSEGMQIRMARVAIGMSLYELGARTGVLPPRLSEFERGRLVLAPATVGRIRAALLEAGAPLAESGDAPEAA